jgi:quinol monooxygenase YgiN
MAGLVQIPWYATLFRGDRLAQALEDIAPVALRYGALDYEVRRSRDDPYRFQQTATFEDHANFYGYWEGPEFIDFRTRYTSWFQVPVLYEWYERLSRGQLDSDAEALVHAEGPPAGDIT